MKKIFYLFVGSVMFNLAHAQVGGVAVNVAGNSPDTSAMFDVSSHLKGELMPRMSTAERNSIASPANGLTIFNTDCNVYNFNAGTPVAPNWATINSSNALIASVNIFANPVGAICGGTGVTFTAIPAADINSPGYQWQVNGLNVGSDSSFYTSTGFNNGDVVTCILSSNAACVIGSPATSNAIVMSVDTIPGTPGSITGNTSLCPDSGGNVYSVNPVAEAAYYTWAVPGDATITAGAGTNSITVTFGFASGNISVIAANSCGASAARVLGVTVNPPVPIAPGAITGSNEVGSNTAGVLYYISPVSNATTYNWTLPAGATITSGQGTDSIMVTFGLDSGAVSVTAGNACGASAASSLYVTVVNCNGYSNGSQTFNYTSGMQYFTVPVCIFSLAINAYGAQGGDGGGYGAEIEGMVAVTPGEMLNVLVGGQGNGEGGGGGTFIVNSTNIPLIVAGGGGGGTNNSNTVGQTATTAADGTESGNYSGNYSGKGGNAGGGGGAGSASDNSTSGGAGGVGCNAGSNTNGSSPNCGAGGGGFCGNCGSSSGAESTGGEAYTNGGGGGYGEGGDGGYGGGGGGYSGFGGGGGYSGGGGGAWDTGWGNAWGGGGGSYNSGINQTNNAGVQGGNGMVTFTW